MKNQPHIGAHVMTPEGWGYIRSKPTVHIDLWGVQMDDDDRLVNFYAKDVRMETFKEFVFDRPGKVGAWGKGDFLLLQAFFLFGFVWCGIAILDYGLWVLLFLLAVEVMIYRGMRRNWKGEAM